MPAGSRPFVGSSRISSFGLPSSAMAMPSRCFMPSEYCPTLRLRSCVRCTMSSTRPMSLWGTPFKSATISRFSCAVRCRYPAGDSIRLPVWRSSGRRLFSVSSCPSRRTRPAVGWMSPSSIFMVVDLPAPFGPMNPYTHPCGTCSSTWSTAVCGPYCLHRAFVSITVCIMHTPLLSVWPYATPCALNEL